MHELAWAQIRGAVLRRRPVKQMDDHWPAIQGTVAIPKIVTASKSKTYERDVCIRCGETIEKPRPL